MEEPFSKWFSWQMGGNFWGGELTEGLLCMAHMGGVLRGNYVWSLVIFVIFMGFGGAEVGHALKSSIGESHASHKSGEAVLMEKERWCPHYM